MQNSESEGRLSRYIGPISAEAKGATIAGRHFNSAVGLIGAGTGLEALVTAKFCPEAAIIAVDPFSRFGKNVIEQLAKMNPTRRNRIDWGFLEEDSALQKEYWQLTGIKANQPQTWEAIEKEFLRYQTTARRAKERIFMVEATTGNAQPDMPIFDTIEVLYPITPLHIEPSLYTFLDKGLKEGGKWKVMTDKAAINFLFFANMGDSVRAFGRIDRPQGVKHAHSVYDLAFGQSGYYYIGGTKEGHLPTPGSTALSIRIAPFGLPWAAYHGLRAMFSKHRVNGVEK